jgi:protein SCO1/2
MTRQIGLALAWVMAVGVAPAVAQSPAGHEAHAAPAARGATLRTLTPPPVIPDVTLIDHHGRPIALAEAIGTDAPVLVNFIFTSCTTICPVMSAGFSQFQSALGPDRDVVRLISISIDPDVDTAAALREYAARFGARTSWRFLTGTRETIEATQRAFGAFRGDKSNHAPATYLRRSPGADWQVLDGLSSADTLLRAYRGEAGASRF